MSPVDSFHNEIPTVNHDHSLGREEESQKRERSQRRDRNFVRRALGRGVPATDIEDRLLIVTEFHKLNPEHDPIAYVRGLIDDEGSSLRNVDLARAPATDSSAPRNNSATSSHAAREQQSLQSEVTARRYIQENYEAGDRLAVVVRNRKTGETVQRVTTAQQIATHEFQSWLRHKNARGSDIYLSLNTLKEHAHGRTKADLKEIRHLYLDLDEDGSQKLAAIYQNPAVPHPNYVLHTSPGKFQVIWRVEGLRQNDAEALLRGLAQRFGGDPAATDATRVFRLPGFNNKKYEDNFPVTLAAGTSPAPLYHQSDFGIETVSQPGTAVRRTVSNRGVASETSNSQSEHDLAFALRRLRRGDDPEHIVREIAAYRATDRYDSQETAKLAGPKKPNPRYYAEHTVARAMQQLGMSRTSDAQENRSPETEPDR